MRDRLISHSQVSYFLNKVIQNFPNFAAGVVADKNGFPLASKITHNFPYREQDLALEAIADERNFIPSSQYVKVKRSLNQNGTIKLLLILHKPNQYVNGFKKLKNIIRRQILF
ncbi:MAG: hypothetical protein GF317_09320 [Candidatus Lokiarchaeota archaeon]|nr:hypothetical protein [Candidatus Lokiarchaeota archaeon]MBD3199911.1 hypothetical protein [Candidatus Lokiarchaeota archaeon]